jgi:Holliday junction resolvase RusA-like endonuclease
MQDISAEPIEIEFRGHVPSKKNSYSPRKDKPGLFKNTALQAQLDRLALQIPADVRGICLESPDLHFYFTYEKANWDPDNAMTTVIDLLVEYCVLRDDNLRRCNGTKVIHPAVKGEYDGCRVVIFPRSNVGS